MTIYTPTGMPINFSMDYAFTLLARLSPKYSAHRVLKIADGIDKAPESVAYLIGFITFPSYCSPIAIFILVLTLPSIIRLAGLNSKYVNEIVYLGVIFTSIGKLGLFTVSLFLLGWYSVGWHGLIAFLCARFIGSIISTNLESQERFRIHQLSGANYSEFDRCFIDAYRFCAKRVGVTLETELSNEELKSTIWQLMINDYAQKNPVLFEMKGKIIRPAYGENSAGDRTLHRSRRYCRMNAIDFPLKEKRNYSC